jgi:hypothetical protein
MMAAMSDWSSAVARRIEGRTARVAVVANHYYAAIAARAPLVVDTQNAMKVDCGPGRSIFTL